MYHVYNMCITLLVCLWCIMLSCVLHHLCVYNAWIMFTILVLHMWYLILCTIRVCKSHVRCSVLHLLQCIVVCCSVLQCVAIYCGVLQCDVVCCSMLQWWSVRHVYNTCRPYPLHRIWFSDHPSAPWSDLLFSAGIRLVSSVCIILNTFMSCMNFCFMLFRLFFDPSWLRSFAYTRIFLKESFHHITFEVGARLVIFLPRRRFFIKWFSLIKTSNYSFLLSHHLPPPSPKKKWCVPLMSVYRSYFFISPQIFSITSIDRSCERLYLITFPILLARPSFTCICVWIET